MSGTAEPTVWAFRAAAANVLSSVDAQDLLDRLGSDGWLMRQVGTDSMAAFVTLALVPLTADDWERHTFTAARSVARADEVEGLLTFQFAFDFTPEALDRSVRFGSPVQEPSIENMGVGTYLGSAMDLYATLNNMIDTMSSTMLDDPDAVMEYLNRKYVSIYLGVPYTGSSLDVQYAYQACVDGTTWQPSSTVGSVRTDTGEGAMEAGFENELTLGSLDVGLPDDAVNPLPVDWQWFSYESLGFSKDPYTVQLLYQGELVRLFVDGCQGEDLADPLETPRFYYADANGTLDLRTERDSVGSAALPSGEGTVSFTTPVYGIAELSEEQARAVVDSYGYAHESQYPGLTSTVLYGATDEMEDGTDAMKPTLPSVSWLLTMDPATLVALLEGGGFTYDPAERAFSKDGGRVGDYTGLIKVCVLGAPDTDGRTALSPGQIRGGVPVEAVSAAVLLDDPHETFAEDETATIIELLEAGEDLGETVPVVPPAQTGNYALANIGYQAAGRDALWSASVVNHSGATVSRAYLDYLADLYRTDATYEAICQAGSGIAPTYKDLGIPEAVAP